MATLPSFRMASRMTANACCPTFPVRHDVIGIVEVEFVYLVLGYELIDIDDALALDRDCFQFLGRKLDVVTLRDLVAFDDVSGLEFLAGISIHLFVFDAVAGFFVQLMEADLFAFR